MKNIFLDCGTHICEGLNQFYERGIINKNFEIHTFEANPECNISQRIKNIPLNIIPHEVAVWVEDGLLEFKQENHKKYDTGSTTDGLSDKDGWASCVSSLDFTYPYGEKDWPGYETSVRSIDFSKFIDQFPQDSNIICKMDIEGSEFDVLRHMIKNGTITKISDLYVEFHERWMPNESTETKEKLVDQIQSLGVRVFLWF